MTRQVWKDPDTFPPTLITSSFPPLILFPSTFPCDTFILFNFQPLNLYHSLQFDISLPFEPHKMIYTHITLKGNLTGSSHADDLVYYISFGAPQNLKSVVTATQQFPRGSETSQSFWKLTQNSSKSNKAELSEALPLTGRSCRREMCFSCVHTDQPQH